MAERRTWGGLQTRVLLAAAACAVAGLLPVMLATAVAVSSEAAKALMQPDTPGMVASTAECERAAGNWTHSVRSGAHGYGYDIRTGRSPHPDAPALDPEILRRLQDGEETVAEFRLLPTRPGGTVAVRTQSAAGPCSVIAVSWKPFQGSRPRILRVVLVLGAIFLAVGIFFTQTLAVRPLLRRLLALGEGASQVGGAGFAVPENDPEDAIHRVWTELERAHVRILEGESQLRARQRTLERHMSDVAHDLRTPIAGLQLILEDIARGADDPPGQARTALRDLHYLGALTENLREAARLEEGVHPLAGQPRVDLVGVLARVESRMARLGRDVGVEVTAASDEELLWVVCDGAMVERVVANLVGNAVDAGRQGGHVAVRLVRRGDRFELDVMDDGPGIPAELLARLGQRNLSWTAHREGSRHGAGLGLAIVHEVCQKAEWALAFGTMPDGTGTRVRITGPLAGPAGEGATGLRREG